MYLHAVSFRLANATSLALVLAASLTGCGGDADTPATLDALRADAHAVSAGRAASDPALARTARAERPRDEF